HVEPSCAFNSLLFGPSTARGSKRLRAASVLHRGGTRMPIGVQTSPRAAWREEVPPIVHRPCWRTVSQQQYLHGPNCLAPRKSATTTKTGDLPDVAIDPRSG